MLPFSLSLFSFNTHLHQARNSTLSAQNQRRHVHHRSNYTHQQVYNAVELVFGLGITAFLITACWLCSFHCFRTPAFIQGGFYITVFAITSLKSEFLNYTHGQKCLAYETCIRSCGSHTSFEGLGVYDRAKRCGFTEFSAIFENYDCQSLWVVLCMFKVINKL